MNDLPRTQNASPTPFLHKLIGVALRTFVSTIRILPDWLAYGLADGMTVVLVSYSFASRKRFARRRMGFYHNVRVVFRDRLTGAPRRRLLWRWARHMTHLAIDTCKMPKITVDNVHDYCDLSDMELLRAQYDRGEGVLGVSGHVGVFELTAHLIGLSGMSIVTIFRPSPIRPVSDVINELRGTSGQQMTERKGGVRQVLRALREKCLVGLLIDVSAKRSDIYAPFLGTLAATNNTPGVLHLKTGAPLVVMTTQRTGRRRYRFRVWDVIEHPGDGPREVEAQAIAARLNDALSQAIRSEPEQWFWDSRRFRARPSDEQVGPDGLPPQVEPDQALAPCPKV